ncbi:uncharacterized protein EI97DRAFT_139707 [Westerdykella ornata]|uniref:Ras GEF n=1 Tax=Westerdykella ornata TaxID=318751 RepID=A0A6A6JBG2_WESOR|nr:uncharacterized protein EI97DRAFT_139707 [Westerdykella ornata]KAF2273950.1 hypothetical protein EI97DRAFT_139707 [Westerdykella ornata]
MDGPLGLLPAHDGSTISISTTPHSPPPPLPPPPLAAPSRRPFQPPPPPHLRHQRRPRARTTSSGTAPSASGSGHSFTVANFNRGIIYLRPVVRAPSQRHHHSPPTDTFTFPPHTPPDSATVDSRHLSNDGSDSRLDYTTLPPALGREHARDDRAAPFTSSPPRLAPHTRSRSFSTVDAHTLTSHSTEPGTFKVVIERPPFGRPKTADTAAAPLLEVPIPHYRLGTPRFSAHGTPILRSSVYTRASGTDDFRSTLLSPLRATHSFLSSRPRSDVYSPAPANYRTTMEPGTVHAASVPSSARVSKLPIGPQVYDDLTINPDDPAVVRFSPSGDILGATPSRLVAHITSPSFLDYELLSDFFLTFRSFLSCRDLVAYLISRLQWAVNRQDDFGRIVRVRTFVALRHWILNYFVDDFLPVYSLRVHFCDLVNTLYKALKAREDGGGGDIKIVGELKKCWRRTCALHWDSEDGIGRDMADEDLLPGGQPDSSIALERPQILPMPSGPPGQVEPTAKLETTGSNPNDQFASGHIDWARGLRHTPQNSLSSPFVPCQEYGGPKVPLSPESERSIPVLSCSIPMRLLHRADSPPDAPLYPHPVPNAPTPRFAPSPPFSSPSKRLNRPSHSHKRSGSFSDALRDQRAPLPIPKNAAPDVRLSALSTVPGSLIRGGIFLPGSPFMDVKNGGLRHTRSHLQLEQVDGVGEELHIRGGHGPNPGMKKILGSVRRALSSKQPSITAPHLGAAAHSHHTMNPNRSSHAALVSTASGGVHKRRYARQRPQVRIDMLASKVADSFREAINQQAREDQQPHPPTDSKGDLSEFVFDFEAKETPPPAPASNTASKQDQLRLYSNITVGSKSIVIMDDTGPPDLPFMSGALLNPPADGEPVMATVPTPPQPRSSMGEPLAVSTTPGPAQTPRHSNMDAHIPSDRRVSTDSASHPPSQRQSRSEGRENLHSSRGRGSTMASMTGPTSLRRHASHNSGLSRQNTTASMASFQTMSSHNDPFFLDRQPTAPPAPMRQLRRRPGGDLRAVDNVHDLQHIQRPASTGSISNHTHSVANSVILRSGHFVEASSELNNAHNTEQPEVPKKPISLVDTHSSQPNLRPSFEAEVAKLAALPDDTDDDGGIEAALMKLEGRYEKKTPDPSPRTTLNPQDGDPPAHLRGHTLERSRVQSHADAPHSQSPTSPGADNQGLYHSSTEHFHRRVPDATSGVGSDDSFAVTPLLDRFPIEVGNSPRSETFQSMTSSAKPEPLKPNSPPTWFDRPSPSDLASPNSSVEHVLETESLKRVPKNGTMRGSSIPRESFLLDDDEDLSDMADEASAAVTRSDGTGHGIRSFFDDEPAAADDDKEPLPMHPLHHPPTPPLTANKLGHSPQVSATVFDRGLPTPGLTPTSRLNNQTFEDATQLANSKTEPAIELQELTKDTDQPPPAHFPFVLAFDSEILAQQFTLIEKDALDEVDWKELIELRWKQSSPRIRDWVEYLRTEDARGVDVVIARFNLVVKWVVSEILLTEAIEERAHCIVKYIHIAAHARRLRNYATMYQITIALLSSDISRLKHTWAFIPVSEMHTMRALEALVQPLRNFHNLRVEMETTSVEEGCIPFIGIYTRDLIYNAQKPAFIDTRPVAGERLVNFERYRTAAMIVKSLLRLIEASAKYSFRPDPSIISRCLWVAALTDEEITKLSRRYE